MLFCGSQFKKLKGGVQQSLEGTIQLSVWGVVTVCARRCVCFFLTEGIKGKLDLIIQEFLIVITQV